MPFAQTTPSVTPDGVAPVHPTHSAPTQPLDSQSVTVDKVIRKEGDSYVLYSKDGKKKLGTHDSKAKAEAQERAIYANKG